MNRLPLYLIIIVVVLFSCKRATQNEIKVVRQKDSVAEKKGELQRMKEKQYVRSVKDTVEILKKFFSPDTIITMPTFWKHDTGKIVKVAIWKPDADAEFNMNISEDGKCHTNIDTIMEIPGSKGERYLIVFTTLEVMKDSSLGGCHSCGADYGAAFLVYDKPSGVYGIENYTRKFTSAGNFGGTSDSIALTDFGRDYALLIRSGFTQSGECMETDEFFDARFFDAIFTVQGCDIYDAIDSTESTSVIRNMSFLPGAGHNGYKDIKVSVVNSYFSKPTKNQVTEKSTEYYTWNGNEGRYEKK